MANTTILSTVIGFGSTSSSILFYFIVIGIPTIIATADYYYPITQVFWIVSSVIFVAELVWYVKHRWPPL